jgi:hypothetical protein
MRSPLVVLAPALLLLAAGCGGGEGGGADARSSTRDSAGVTIVEHAAGVWDAAPEWGLSPRPLAVIGGDITDDAELDLSNSQVGALLPDNRLLAASFQPAQLYVFNADGSTQGTLGREGEGPDEYQFLSTLLDLGGDSVAAYDLFKRYVILFDADGAGLGRIEFPLTGTPIPPQLIGRLDDGTWVFQIFNPLAEPPDDAPAIYRLPYPVLTWRDGAEGFDTTFTLLGAESERSSVEAGGRSVRLGRGIAYGANPFVGARGDLIWSTTSDVFTLTAHDAAGALRREVRLQRAPRAVTEADRERFKALVREQLERVRAMMPPGMVESELAKVDQTTFAENYPRIGQMLVDRLGRVWATPDIPVLDTLLTWGIFSPEGELLGKVRLPQGTLFAAADDRVVVRREDNETGLVSLEVWGLLTVCEECDPPSE